MQIIDDLYRNKEIARKLADSISGYRGRPIKLMEVCGTHTMAVSRFGIRSILPPGIRLVSGPGCPVCVTPDGYMKAAAELAGRRDVIIATFGDMMRIPAGNTSLLEEKARGRDIRLVYSPLDCLEIAEQNPDKKVIFLSVGFETTTPVIALSVLNAVQKGIANYMLLTANKTIPAVMRVLASDPEVSVNGFLYPGHVSAITGDALYHELASKYGIPGVIAGFEPVDILGAVRLLADRIDKGEAVVDNMYGRVVKPEGNPVAAEKVRQVFEECDSVWRGIGPVPLSGLRLRQEFSDMDAWRLVESYDGTDSHAKGCKCGEILKGVCVPPQCPLFGKACTPEKPVGACMVSSEGTCAAYYRYNLNEGVKNDE